ncbi:unnamed protein product [Lactuca saligna]|uniref:Uncharacterized protein n=1 Tax=Lactuca saligna TaxID=75948 RepID=A0AA35URG8_LACSI|nr:unnamed protein product [Lactuca saligna]
MIMGLNNCRISHVLRSNPFVFKDLIVDFWKNASVNNKGEGGVGNIESVIKGINIVISEQIIRDVLEFGDALKLPTKYPSSKVKEVLEKMCYEGTYPPTIKKQRPPYWRFLAHYFIICISGRKSGFDEISQTATSAIVALSMNWDYNFSKFVFEEMNRNHQGKKKDQFLMYPRFLQMILNEKYSQIERSSNTLEMKALGPSTFGLMKQSRKTTKITFQGARELV